MPPTLLDDRTGRGTRESPLTDTQVNDLGSQGIREGDNVPGKGQLLPGGYFAEPTVGETLQGIKTQAMTIQDQLNQMRGSGTTTKGSGFQSPTLASNNVADPTLNPIDEKAIQRNQMRLFQNEIDATNKVYDQLYNQKVLEGTGRLGTQRAQAARGGLLGSDFGTAQQERVQSYNTAEQQAVQAERQAKIGSIMGKVRTAVSDDIAAKRLARTQDADAYLKYLTSRDETRSKNTQAIAESFLTQGIDPVTLSPDEMKAITGESGISAADIINSYRNAKATQESATAETDLKTRKTEAEIKKIDADIARGKLVTIGEGTMLYDTETGETFKNPKTYAPSSGGGSGLKLGSQSLSQDQISGVHQTLQETRGEDGYANTQVYMDELEGFVSLGGDPKDFIKEYAPDVYINPKDPSRSFLESQMKKQTSNSSLGVGELSFESL